jgi:hypothetical protein
LIATRYFNGTINGSREPDKKYLGIMIRSHGETHNLDTIISIRLFIPDKHDEETAGLHNKET